MIDHANALDWLRGGNEYDMILTDPPHLDIYQSGADHWAFTKEWVELARISLKPSGVLLHSCGPSPVELKNYMTCGSMPDQILVWPWPQEPHYPDAPANLLAPSHHFFLVYLKVKAERRWSGETVLGYREEVVGYGDFGITPFRKEDNGLWKNLITTWCPIGGTVADPFCGRGEVPAAAREAHRAWAGCDIDASAVDYCNALGL